MDQPQGYLDGRIVPLSEMAIPVTDSGFNLGITVTEQMRTFAGKIFELDRHLQRLKRSLDIVGIDPSESLEDLARIANALVQTNYALLESDDDLGLTLFVTSGVLPRLNGGQVCAPCVGIHTFPLPFWSWGEKYRLGQSLVITETEQVSSRCWPAELKCRSRMHYYLADQSAEKIESGSRALLLDAAGQVIETSTANVLIYNRLTGISTPPETNALPGISLLFVRKLADQFGIPWKHRPLLTADIASAEEVFLSSTPFGLLPVTRFNGQPIADGNPGPLFEKLVGAWSREVGVDLVRQAHMFAKRNPVQQPVQSKGPAC